MRILLAVFWRQTKQHPVLGILLALFLLLTAGMWVAEPLYSGYAVDQLMTLAQPGAHLDYTRLFGWWALILAGVGISEGGRRYLEWKFSMQIELEGVERNYRNAMLLSMHFHTTQRSGETMKIIGDGAEYGSQLARNTIDLLPSFLAGFTFLIIGSMIEWRLAAAMMVMVLFILVVMVFGTLKTAKLQHKINWLWTIPSGRAMDAFANVTSVKSGAQENRELAYMHELHEEALEKQLRVNRLWALLEGIPFFMITRILLIVISVILLAHGKLTLGQLYFFQASFFRVLTPFEMLTGILPQWNKSIGKVAMAEKLLKLRPEPGIEKRGSIPAKLEGRIEFKDVSFSYLAQERHDEIRQVEDLSHEPQLQPDAETEQAPDHVQPSETETQIEEKEEMEDATLEHIELTIKPGEHIALVGESGAGKSTMAMLLNRFYDVTDGAILIDGKDLRDIDVQWWRAQIGLVLQENLMFNDSVINNIRYARPDASKEEVIEAAKRASADEFIGKLPKGYETEIGERGVKLSGGQRQRLAIARAILKNPKIVILDEATSALDSITEKHVQEGIRELMTGRTAVVIAHRLSTVRSVDRIAVMDKGRVLACAPHEELLKTSDIYRSMVELQSGGLLHETA